MQSSDGPKDVFISPGVPSLFQDGYLVILSRIDVVCLCLGPSLGEVCILSNRNTKISHSVRGLFLIIIKVIADSHYVR